VDVETTEAIERLTERIDLLETSLRAEFRGGQAGLGEDLRGEFQSGLAGLREDLRGEFQSGLVGLREDLRGEFRGGLAGLRDELREETQEGRRHASVLNEATRDDIRLVAEAVAHLTLKVDSLRR
jgi:hypothetical protein